MDLDERKHLAELNALGIENIKKLKSSVEHTKVLRVLCKKSLKSFVQTFWHVIEGQPFTDGWHIGAICEHLEAVYSGQINRLIVNVPPRHTKSSLCSVFWPAQGWLLDPSLTYFVVGAGQTVVWDDARKMRKIVESPLFQELRSVGIDKEANSVQLFKNMNNGYRYTTSIGGQIFGRGGRVILLDDPNGPDSAHSEAARQKTNDFYFGAMCTRDNDPKNSKRVLVQQRVCDGDLTGEILKREGKEAWVHLRLAAEYDPKIVSYTPLTTYKDPRTTPGELLWKERFSKKDIAELKHTMREAAAAQLQQEPATAKGGIFPSDSWRYFDELPKDIDEWTIWGDLTFKGEIENDYCSLAVVAHKGSKHYVVHIASGLWDFDKQVKELKAIKRMFPFVHKIYLEDAGNAASVKNTLQDQITCELIPAKKVGSKDNMWGSASFLVKNGSILLPRDKTEIIFPTGETHICHFDCRDRAWSGIEAFIHEASLIPRGNNDDMVDSVCKNVLYWEICHPYFIEKCGFVESDDPIFEGLDRGRTSDGGWLFDRKSRLFTQGLFERETLSRRPFLGGY